MNFGRNIETGEYYLTLQDTCKWYTAEEINSGYVEVPSEYYEEIKDIIERQNKQFLKHKLLKEEKYTMANEKPFIVVFRSKPIMGIILELYGKNPNYKWKESDIE